MMKLIICLTGMPGAGKSTVAKSFTNSCFQVLSMGDVIRREAERRGLEPTDENLGRIMLELRDKQGLGAVANLVVDEIKDDKRHVIIDGLRNMKEVEILKQHGRVKVLAIHAPRDKRLEYLRKRNRSDAPKSIEEFDARDKRELAVGLGEAISYADAIIMNDSTIDDLKKKAYDIIERWKSELNA
ncbi:MAG: dephospho-CoA kinase [Candidatus Nitrosocaldaceae archaeon]|nr:MAG: dephospho-CoA kinase [Candidatus Nitrosocaldaceae archaeon]